MNSPKIQQLPEKSGEYILSISKFDEPEFTVRVIYSYELGLWISIEEDGKTIGSRDMLNHNAEWHNIHSFREPDKFDLS